MILLQIKHLDFELFIECSKYEKVWNNAMRNIEKDSLSSIYTWSEGVESVHRVEGSQMTPLENGQSAQVTFFDNTEYCLWIEFNDETEEACFASMLQADNERMTFHKKGKVLSGFINYGNDIGRSEIKIQYTIQGQSKTFCFSFDVLSSKLNYHEHWRKIVEDIEAEYRMLSLAYLKRTFHGFGTDTEGDRQDLIWWSIFQAEQEKFIRAIQCIIERPCRKLQSTRTYQHAHKLRRITASLENEIAENRLDANHMYYVEETTNSHDTQENRFLKYVLYDITAKYGRLKYRIESIKNVSEVIRQEMDILQTKLKRLQNSPFFRTVGRFKGLNQENLVLQKASAYSQVYRTWTYLRRAYSLNDGIYRLQSKDIAKLYEIWCFIEMSHIVKEQLNLSDDHVKHLNRKEMNNLFTWELGKGEKSRILFEKDDTIIAELVYNPKHDDNDNSSISMENLRVPTVAQKPDIVLQIYKDDLQKGMKLTYVFDAKYRIAGRNSRGVDIPPEDAINQMHRYRDAIYYKPDSSSELKKEIIGGFILFPGSGKPNDIESAKFYETINEVNIGAFPLRPDDPENRKLLERFISDIISKTTEEVLSDCIPQKGLNYVIEG